jgi:hypothetical protein
MHLFSLFYLYFGLRPRFWLRRSHSVNCYAGYPEVCSMGCYSSRQAHMSVLLLSKAMRLQCKTVLTNQHGNKILSLFGMKRKGQKRTKVSQLRNNWRRDFWYRHLRHITSKNNKKHFPLFLYQHKESLGLLHCNCIFPAAKQGYVYDTVKFPEKISPDY